MGKTIDIGGRIHNPEVGNIVTGANEILDDTKNKKQDVINSEVDSVLEALDANKQDNLTFDQTPTESSTNPVTSGGVYAADALLQQAIEAILALIPSAATALNQLADKAFVNSTVATNTATFRGTYNVVTDLGLAYNASHQDIATALLSHISTADNNDYCFVQIPTSDTSSDIRVTERYKFNGTAWAYEYDLNNSGFTATQWDAINSGITALLVTKLGALPTAAELATSLAGKQNVLTFDNVPVSGSDNPVKSGGLYQLFTAIDAKFPSDASANNKLVAENRLAAYVTAIIGALDATYNVTSTDGHVTVKVTQVDGAITNVEVNTSDIASAAALNTLSNDVEGLHVQVDALTGQKYVTVTATDQTTAATDVLPASGQATDTIYRIGSWDGTQYDPNTYSEYAWNGTSYQFLDKKNVGIDTLPTPNRTNVVESGGVFYPQSILFLQLSTYLEQHLNTYDLSNYENVSVTVATDTQISSDGTVVAYSGQNTGSFSCNTGEVYFLMRIKSNPATNISLVLLDGDNRIIAAYTYAQLGNPSTKYIIIPHGVKKVLYNTVGNNPIVRKYTIFNENRYLYMMNCGLGKLTNGLKEVELDGSDLTEEGLIDSTGWMRYTSKWSTPIYPYSPNNKYVYSGYGAYGCCMAAYYDRNGQFISASAEIPLGIATNIELTNIPSGTFGIQFCSAGSAERFKVVITPPSTQTKANKLVLDFSINAVSYIQSPFNGSYDLKHNFIMNFTLYNKTFNFKDVYKVNRQTFEETLCKDETDDICPVFFGGADYIGANHGAKCLLTVSAESHGKDNSDIGSIWSDGTHQFTIVGIKDSNNLFMIGENTDTYPKFIFASPESASGSMTHVSGATHDSSISYASYSLGQWHPFYKSEPIKKVYVDGELIETSGTYFFDDNMKVTEDYDILNPASVLSKIQQGAGTFSANPTPQNFSNTADVLLHISNVYEFKSASTCFVATSLCLNQESSMEHFGFTQSATLNTTNGKLYIPKAKSKGNGATEVDFRTIVNITEGNGQIRRLDWENQDGIPPERILTYDDNIAFHLGYMFDYGVGGLNRNAALRGNTAIYISGGYKLYPYGWQAPVGEYITGTYQNKSSVCFRHFIDRSIVNTSGIIESSVFEYKGHLYIYADFNAVGNYYIEIPEKYRGRQVVTLEKRTNVTLCTENAGENIMFHVDTDDVMYGYFVGKI